MTEFFDKQAITKINDQGENNPYCWYICPVHSISFFGQIDQKLAVKKVSENDSWFFCVLVKIDQNTKNEKWIEPENWHYVINRVKRGLPVLFKYAYALPCIDIKFGNRLYSKEKRRA